MWLLRSRATWDLLELYRFLYTNARIQEWFVGGALRPPWVGAAWSPRFAALFLGLFRMSGTGMLLCPAEYDEEEIAREGGHVSKRRQFIHCQWAPPGTEGEGEPGVVGTVGKLSLRRHRSPSVALRSCPRNLYGRSCQSLSHAQ